MFADRDIRRVVAARFIGRLGGEAAFFVGIWGLAAYRFHATAAQIAPVMFILAVSSMIGAAIAGVLIDRHGPRAVLIGAELAYIPVALSMTLVDSLPLLMVLVAVFGLVGTPIFTATAAFGPYLTETTEELQKANAFIEGAGSLSFVMGPAIGAALASMVSLDAVFYFDAIATAAATLLVLGVHTRKLPGGERRHPLAELCEGLRVTYSLRGVRYYVLLGTAVWFGFGAFSALEPLFYRDAVHTSVATIGWVNSIFGLGLVLGSMLLAKLPERVLSARGLAITASACGLGAAAYVGTTDLRTIAVGALVWGTIIGLTEPMLRTLVQSETPDELVGRVTGTAQIHRQAGELLPLALAPTLSAAFGVQPVLIGNGVFVAIVTLCTLPIAARIDRARGEVRVRRATGMSLVDEPLSPNP